MKLGRNIMVQVKDQIWDQVRLPEWNQVRNKVFNQVNNSQVYIQVRNGIR